MSDTQRENQVIEDSGPGQTDEPQPQESSARPVMRMLANPRRIRRL